MAPPGSAKRKRPDRQYSQEDGANRPSPHRPDSLQLAQYGNHPGPRGGARGRGGRRAPSQTHISHSASSASNRASPLPRSTQPEASPSSTEITSQPAVAQDPLRSILPPSLPSYDDPTDSSKPYAYDHLTDDVLKAWEGEGRASLLSNALELSPIDLTVLLQELVRAGLDGKLKPTSAGEAISQLCSQEREDEDVSSIFLDTISLLEDKDQRRRALYDIVAASGIDPHDIRHELDVQLLQSLQLVRQTFNQMRTRKTTNILYRQANFNLLREESEGYAKLITDFYNASQDASHESADPEAGKEAFHKVMALVGAFDLDVGRVLDVIMDISANTLVKAYRFFLKFYRYSSWWPKHAVLDNIAWTQEDLSGVPGWALPDSGKWQYDDQDKAQLQALKQLRDEKFWPRVAENGMQAFFELGARRITDFEAVLPVLEQVVEPELDGKGKEVNPDKRKRTNESRKYMRETKTLPPPGSPDAAQLLGFKLRFYASDVRDKTDVLPENLIYLAALLIKVGFISLKDLYPHLYPADEAMDQERARLEKEKDDKERATRPGGGLNALASAAALTDDSGPAVRNLRADNAKSGGSTPKPDKKEDASGDELPPPSNQKLVLLKALLAIGALPEALFILSKFPWLLEVDISLTAYLLRIVKQMLSKLTAAVRPLADEQDTQMTRSQLADTRIGADGVLMLKPRPRTRIRKWLGLESVDSGDGFAERHYYTDWDENIPVCQTIDDFFVLCDTFINLIGVKVGSDVVILSTMIRLAKQDLAHNIGVDNKARWLDLIRRLILPALTMTKHNPGLTEELYSLLLNFDVITRYGLYEEWYFGKTSRNPDVKAAFNKNRFEAKDVLRRITNESGKKMARALAKVTYSSPGIVIMTFINQLESYSNMIKSLAESVRYFTPLAWEILTWVLIRSVSGQGRDRIQADGMLTSPWLQALSQFAAVLFSKYDSANASPVLQYVASELRSGDSTDLELIDQVVSEMAGIKSDMNFNDTQILAMTGGEALQSVIVQQLGDRRAECKSSAKRLMKALSDPGITAQLLISIAQERHMYAHREAASNMPLKVLGNNLDKIQQVFAQYLEMLRMNMSPTDFQAQIPDVCTLIRDFGLEPGIAFTISRMFIAHLMTLSDAIRRRSAKGITEEDASTAASNEAEEQEYSAVTGTAPDTKDFNTWYPFLEDYAEKLPAVTGGLDQRVNALFYTVFWSFAAEHINAPLNVYEDESKKINTQIDALTKERATGKTLQDNQKKIATLKEVLPQLRGEMSGRVSTFGDTKKWFAARKKDWFPSSSTQEETDVRHLHLLQECLLPRALLSSLDSQYCFSIIKTLHSVATSGFSVLSLLDQLMRSDLLSSIIFQSTAREAENFGRFLCELLKLLGAWHADKALYEKEAHGSRRNLVGFATRTDEDGTPLEQLEFEDFRRKLFDWHSNLKDALRTCFESGEYMQIRNGIVTLKAVCSVYPLLKFHGRILQDLLKSIATSDSRDDLKLAALSLQGPLKMREKKWIIVQDFKMNDGTDDVAMVDDADTSGTKLNAQANEFKPNEGRIGAEDGEIEDEKDTAKTTKAPAETKDAMEGVQVTSNATAPGDSVGSEIATTAPAQSATAKAAVVPSKPASRAPSTSRPAPERVPSRADERPSRPTRPQEQRPARDVPQSSRDRDNARAQERPVRRDRTPPRPLRSSEPARNEQYGRNAERRPLEGPVRLEHVNRERAAIGFHVDRATQSRTDEGRPGPRLPPQQSGSEMSSVVSQASINPARAALIGETERPASRANGHSQQETTPTGPKSARTTGGRDLFDGAASRKGPQDQSRGRLSRDGQNSQSNGIESSYGRLNGSSDLSRAPEGPSSDRGLRQIASSMTSTVPRAPIQTDTTTRPPDSPGARRSQRGRNETIDVNAGVESSAAPSNDSGPAIHPSRLANLGVDTNAAQSGSRSTASTASVPSGPRSFNRPPPGTPTGPSPTSNSSNGPGFSNERQRRSDRGRTNGPQTASPTNNNQGVSFRGAARQNNTTNNAPSAEQPRVLASSMEAPSRPESASFVGMDRGRAEMLQRAAAGDMHRGPERNDQRPGRPSSRERHFANGESRPVEQYSGGPRRPPPPSAPGSFAGPPPSHEWDSRQGGRGAGDRGKEFRGPLRRPESTGAGRGLAPPPAAEIEGRKRRYDEGGQPPFDGAKRRRSNR